MTRTILRLEEVAQITGVPVETLRYWRKIGKARPRSYKLGRRVVYDAGEVEAWIDEQRQAQQYVQEPA